MVRNISVVAILAMMGEMMLPEGTMRRYINLVFGLLVILAVIQPVVGFLRDDWTKVAYDLPLDGVVQEAQVTEDGKALSDGWNKEARDNYSQDLARQIVALVSMLDPVLAAKAEVELNDTDNITLINIQVQTTADKAELSALEDKIKVVVSNFYDLDKEHIIVSESQEGL